MTLLRPQPLTADLFARFGDVIEAAGTPDLMINDGLCGRFHDRARLDFGAASGGRAALSVFDAVPRDLPYSFDMVERHPEGSQAFLPMSLQPFLVIVAPDEGGIPGTPLAFLTAPGQGINLHRGTWHGVLVPLHAPGLFAVLDRVGPGPNLQTHHFPQPFTVMPA